MPKFKVVVCRGPDCGDKRGSRAIYDAFVAELSAAGLEDVVELGWQSCYGHCTIGPNVLVRRLVADEAPKRRALATLPAPRGARSILYNHVTPDDVAEIVRVHIEGGRLVRRLVDRRRPTSDPVRLRATSVTVTEGDS